MRAASRLGRVPAKKSASKRAKTTAKKSAARKAAPKKPAAKKATKKAATTKAAPRADKAEGPAAVRAVIAKLPAEHRKMAERLDAIVARAVPDAKRAVKWGTPMWGVEGRGWFAAFASFKTYAKVNFFRGALLDPAPPEGVGKEMRSVNIPSLAAFDERQLTSWVKQASAMQGWGK